MVLFNILSAMRFRKIFLPVVLLTTSLYILLPTADEVLIHPTFGLFLSYALSIPYAYGVLLSIIIYRAVGVGCLIIAIAIGGKPTYCLLKEKLAARRVIQKA
jgi:hypothetical protein